MNSSSLTSPLRFCPSKPSLLPPLFLTYRFIRRIPGALTRKVEWADKPISDPPECHIPVCRVCARRLSRSFDKLPRQNEMFIVTTDIIGASYCCLDWERKLRREYWKRWMWKFVIDSFPTAAFDEGLTDWLICFILMIFTIGLHSTLK